MKMYLLLMITVFSVCSTFAADQDNEKSAKVVGNKDISSAKEFVEVVPYFSGKDEICLEDDQNPKPGEVLNVQLTKIVVLSDFHPDTQSRETYCTISVETPDHGERKFSASFSDRCRQLFTSTQVNYRLLVVEDHICEILN